MIKWLSFTGLFLIATGTALAATALTFSPFDTPIADQACGKTTMNSLKAVALITDILSGALLLYSIFVLITYKGFCRGIGLKLSKWGMSAFAVLNFIFSIASWAISVEKLNSTQTFNVTSTATITLSECGLPHFSMPFIPLFAANTACSLFGFLVLVLIPDPEEEGLSGTSTRGIFGTG